MKKKHLKVNLSLNKRSISNLQFELKGGLTSVEFSCHTTRESEYICHPKTVVKSECNDCDVIDPQNSKPFLACVSNWC